MTSPGSTQVTSRAWAGGTGPLKGGLSRRSGASSHFERAQFRLSEAGAHTARVGQARGGGDPDQQ